ncbi:MAG TPA: type II toxin-antitoxin system VapC family toxin [Terriglobia bacterium]|nr:type II toxin-antitoxin system VapC family toxin [Terriglobia bacterium]
MSEFVLDASFALCWCFEDEATKETESILTALQNQKSVAWVPEIWRHELLNGLGKGVSRGRLTRSKAFLLWEEMLALPIHVVTVPVDERLLELALKHNLAVYDATYLGLAQNRQVPLATVDGKLQQAAESTGLQVIRP